MKQTAKKTARKHEAVCLPAPGCAGPGSCGDPVNHNAKKFGAIQTAISHICSNLDQLKNSIGLLRERLAPVLKQEPKAIASYSEDVSPACSIGNELREKHGLILSIQRDVEDLIDCLDI